MTDRLKANRSPVADQSPMAKKTKKTNQSPNQLESGRTRPHPTLVECE